MRRRGDRLWARARHFTVPLETETVVEGQGLLGGVLGSLGLTGFDGFDLSSSQEFENNNTQKDRVQEVYLTSLSLSATQPDGASLDFIETITFFASAPGEQRVQVATGTVAEGAPASTSTWVTWIRRPTCAPTR